MNKLTMRLALLLLFGAAALAQRVVSPGQITEVSGTGNIAVTSTGTQTSGDCVQIDANGNHVAAGAACGSGSGATGPTGATGPAGPTGATGPAGATGPSVALTFLGVPITGGVFRRGTATGAIGDVDIYTCAASSVCIISDVAAYDSSAGSITWYMEIKHGVTYYRTTTAITIATNVVNTSVGGAFPLMAGDTLAVNSVTTAGLNLSFGILEFPDTNPVKAVMKYGLSNGDNTLFTVSGGKTASTGGCGSAVNVGQGTGGLTTCGPLIGFMADGAGTRTIFLNVVPSGATPATANKVSGGVTVAVNTRSVATSFGLLGFTMTAGDFVSINVDGGAATQLAWAVWMEI